MKKRTEKKRMGMAGFTLIELMIVIAIIGILAAIAIPNFLYARNKSKYSACLESMSTVSKGMQSYLTENNNLDGLVGNELEGICNHVLPGFDTQAQCLALGAVAKRMDSSCAKGSVKAAVNTPAAFQYEITGTADDKMQCGICVTEVGYYPDKYETCEKTQGGAADCTSLH